MKKVKHRNQSLRFSFASFAFLLFFSSFTFAQEADPAVGKQLFNTHCAACHKLDRKSTGPALRNVVSKHETEWFYKWIKNSAGLVASGDAEAIEIFEEYNKSPMAAFPQLSNADIDNILAYTSEPKPVPPKIEVTAGDVAEGGISNDIVLAILVLVFLILVVMLFLVNKVLRKIAAAQGVEIEEKEARTPIWKAFVQNQFLVFVTAIFLLLTSCYFVFGYLMQIDVNQGYAPVQPIHFSHRIHAGDNEIDCKYCHSSVRTSKTSGIPSLNVCMNCHKNISEVAFETATEDYTKDYYDSQIAKLYDAVGWDVAAQKYTGKEKPVKWVRIHNLPDFAYFNHSQHVMVAGVDCKKCHGEIEKMEIVEQFSPLTMNWCITCHRETNVKMEGNAYYEKMHTELSKKYGVEKLTAAQMGALECGKCHY